MIMDWFVLPFAPLVSSRGMQKIFFLINEFGSIILWSTVKSTVMMCKSRWVVDLKKDTFFFSSQIRSKVGNNNLYSIVTTTVPVLTRQDVIVISDDPSGNYILLFLPSDSFQIDSDSILLAATRRALVINLPSNTHKKHKTNKQTQPIILNQGRFEVQY
jgi:hypothetical protein